MFCSNCGKEISNDSQFCTYCGFKINTSIQPINNNNLSNQREQIDMQIKMEQLKMQQQQMYIQAEQLRIQQEQLNNMLRCPRCGSTSISSNKKGYGVVKGGLGAITAIGLAPFTGGASLAAGAIGAGAGNIGANKVICTCMNCGYKFKAGKAKKHR